ncbi:Thioredoxin [Halogranum amylolyticum]|uniref:Thioredoxin n=1 Tax=Halogranum amylolyticum TaxID=660520 RepID=A0A1H8N3C6_9EURY|nr:thioredoxin family protein [Halogranum amylolyticum]SEO23978.1 Thioredoxin [Halogranum amylolyticum]
MSDTRLSSKPIRLDDRTALDAAIDEHDDLLVEFYTEGCGKCKMQEPILGNVARATGVTVAMINASYTLDLVEELEMQGVPTLLLYRDGELVEQWFGYHGTEELVELVEAAH